MNHIGIDPGKSGGIALVSDDHRQAWKIPETERDLWELLASFDDGNTFATIEKVASSPQMGVKSAFTFGAGYGKLRMALIAAGIPFETVSPSRWQRTLGCLSKGDKNVTKAKAQELFPELKITHAIADSLLIAEFGRRTRKGEA